VASAARSSWAAKKCASAMALRESEISELKSRVAAGARLGVNGEARDAPGTNSLLAQDTSSQTPGMTASATDPCPCRPPPTVCWGSVDAAQKRLSPTATPCPAMLSPQRQSHLEWAALDQKLMEMRKTSTDALRISGPAVGHTRVDPVVQPMVGMVGSLERERGRRAGGVRRALHHIATSAHQEQVGCQRGAGATAPFLRGQQEPTEMYHLAGYLGGNLGEYTGNTTEGFAGSRGTAEVEMGALSARTSPAQARLPLGIVLPLRNRATGARLILPLGRREVRNQHREE